MVRTKADYTLRINLRSGTDKRRFCEVHVYGDEVYMFQPRKGGSTKISYHKSGQKHLKVGNGPPLYEPKFLDPPEWIETEEECFHKSFENFAKLLPYEDEAADDVYEIELQPGQCSKLNFGVVSIGRFFTPKAWEEEGVSLTTLEQRRFRISSSSSGLSICVRVLQLQETTS